jgi:uncharacterized membrane protein (UPF0127 family)
MITGIVIADRRHDAKHYVGLSLQTILIYMVFIGGVFSVPAAQFIAKKVSAMEVQRGVIGETSVTLDLASNDRERTRGLSGVVSMPKKHGMLFIFDENKEHGIWMKEMKFSLDIIWLNEYSEVIHIERNVSPETFPKVFGPSAPSRFVLEFNAGFVAKNSIKVGDKFVLM